MPLAHRTGGKGDALVLVHGFTQSGESWEPIARRLRIDHQVTTVDVPGHGASSHVMADMWDGARLISEVGGRAAYLGYSMGGRLALHVALLRPDLVTRLVVVSATGGIDDPQGRRKRRADDEALAVRVERDGVETFVRWWLQRPLFSTLPSDAAAMKSRLGNTTAGLASSLRLAGTGTQEPLWDRLATLSMPVLVVAGELDEPYVATAQRLVAAIGVTAALAVIPGAGHACHLEAPDAFLAEVAPFLAH